jgi:hypothetical protein
MIRTDIRLDDTRQLTIKEKLRILQAAYAVRPTTRIRAELAALLLQDDAFAAVIDLFDACADLNFYEEMMLLQALLGRETAVDNQRARVTADRAYALASTDDHRAAALADRAKAEIRLSNVTAARDTLSRALHYDPANKNACKRLAALDLAADDPAEVIIMADNLSRQGAAHARLFAARALAQARLGAIDAARGTIGFDDLHHAQPLPAPEGWADIESFNVALAAELLAHPGLRYERYGSASELTWRIDFPATREAPLVNLLLRQIAATLGEHINRVAQLDHPWVRARPTSAKLHSWCVITESDGFETWHVHQFGWLSGVYYVSIPDSIAHGEDDGGCLGFGLPGDLTGGENAAAYGTHIIRPQNGMMIAFPSHTYHRTFPHGLREKRIALAFDLRPD